MSEEGKEMAKNSKEEVKQNGVLNGDGDDDFTNVDGSVSATVDFVQVDRDSTRKNHYYYTWLNGEKIVKKY